MEADEHPIDDWQILHWAYDGDSFEEVSSLVDLGTDIDLQNDDDMTLLSRAAFEGEIDWVKFLIRSGANLAFSGEQACDAALAQGHLNIAEMLIVHGVSLNRKSSSLTPLGYAALCGPDGALSFILKQNIDLHQTDDSGMTALHHASCSGSLYRVKILVEAGLDCEVTDNNGMTPQDWARENEQDEVVAFLQSMAGPKH